MKHTLPQNPAASEMFNKDMASAYDARNSNLSAISENMHFLIDLVLADLPDRAHILCIGVGTGAEILSLAKARPQWTFVGVDPAPHMLSVCREKLKQAGIMDRCKLVEGYVDDVKAIGKFDAALSVLVAHFISHTERSVFYGAIFDRLKPNGYFVSTEISYDLTSPEFPSMFKNWEQVQMRMGATQQSLQTLPNVLKNMLSVLPPDETKAMISYAGFDLPVQFFQAFMIQGLYAVKPA